MEDSKDQETQPPFWSVMIPAYNSTQFIPTVLESVLSQDPGVDQMQIEVIDDCSSEDPAPEVFRVAGDRVSVFRQPKNLGLAGNWNACIERARGRYVHILHSDDYVLPGYYEKLAAGLRAHPEAGAAFCRPAIEQRATGTIRLHDLELPEAGLLPADWILKYIVMNRILFPTIVVSKSAYEAVGPFRDDLVHALDWEMWMRIVHHYPVWYEPEPLARFVMHGSSVTDNLAGNAATVPDIRKALHIMAACLPPGKARSALALAMRQQACNAIDDGRVFIERGLIRTGLRFILEALRCSRHHWVLQRIIGVMPLVMRKTLSRYSHLPRSSP